MHSFFFKQTCKYVDRHAKVFVCRYICINVDRNARVCRYVCIDVKVKVKVLI